MKQSQKVVCLVLLFVVAIALFMGYKLTGNLDYVLSRRSIRLATMLVVGVSIAFASLIFQTVTNNRILTPAMMGYEAIFILFQTILVFCYGDSALQLIPQELNFLYAVLLMMVFSLFMYLLIFGRKGKSIYYLLLMGMVMGTLFMTSSQFLQVLIDPDDFAVIQNYMFVSFAKMNSKLLLIASVALFLAILLALRYLRYLNVIALGREHAINLGLNYYRLIRIYLLIIALLVSVSTALVGPITFLGILVTNLTYELFHTRKHEHMLWLCSLIACTCIIAGQFLVEHVLRFSTTVSIVINFIGGVYFMYLIWKTRKRAN
ncbi:iron chelate uptake ABC transporter family permease subunit [Sphingobacterium sp. Mn56C]|uniref:iron chelate uptake ABC transporter family permease subunit n=1 Tax=Sphingobacterium sp. Mn56C TaxID=3395261 RepID=UPI003BCE6483